MSKVGEIVENIYSKISWKVIGYVFIALFLFKSCQSCNRSNKIERLTKNHIEVVDSLNSRCDSLVIANDKLNTIIEGKNDKENALNNAHNLGEDYLKYTIKNLQDTVASKNKTIKNLKRVISEKNDEIVKLNELISEK